MLIVTAILSALLGSALAECPNACSSHGRCGAYDMCTCYRNWMSNDCSERICQFGLAHVDTPKGDLDASGGALSGPATKVITNSFMYPQGTSEQFPNVVDSDQNTLTNSAHGYMECSNKGLCDRQTGSCQCFPGYEGSACQRASCPDTGSGVCSGHGTCESVRNLAWNDNRNIYRLWDEDATMGCKCDGGYQGANCEEKVCKYGVDPLYSVWPQTPRFANWTYTIFTRYAGTVTGNYSLIFGDATGEDWQTIPIDVAATCDDVVAALEGLPNNAIPADSVLCQKWTTEHLRLHYASNLPVYEPVDPRDTSGNYQMIAKFTLAFPGNPGESPSLKLNTYLDGTRPSLYSSETSDPSLSWRVYSNGFYGENTDMVPDLCAGVKVTLAQSLDLTYDYLSGISATEDILLRKCLGDSDATTSNNVGTGYSWDTGSVDNPHLIKLVDATQDEDQYVDSDATHSVPKKSPVSWLCNPYNSASVCTRNNPPGFYAVVYHDGTRFRVVTRAAQDYGLTTEFYVYTTTGYLARVDVNNVAFNNWELMANITQSMHSNILYTKYASGSTQSHNDLSCETNTNSLTDCLSKNDYFMVFNMGGSWHTPAATVQNIYQHASNPIYPQIYKVKKISREPVPQSLYDAAGAEDGTVAFTTTTQPTFVRNQIIADKSFNSGFRAHRTPLYDTSAHVYKFYPPTNGYNFAGQCSQRGVCDHAAGQCQCFSGFTTDNCRSIDALAQ